MRVRLALLVGFAAGYVLGARAGRERYAQILQWWNQMKGSEQAQQVQNEVRQAAQKVSESAEAKAAEGAAKAGEFAERSGNDGG